MAILKNTTINDTGFIRLPSGTTAQRPTASIAMSRYNSTLGMFEVYNGVNWAPTRVKYETISFINNNSNHTFTGNNGTTNVSIYKTGGVASWDTHAYCPTAFTAPCTLEFTKNSDIAYGVDNGLSYAMIGWNEDPTTDVSYTSLDYASYPYRNDTYVIYHNGNGVATGIPWFHDRPFYLAYSTDGNIRHYNGSTLLYTGFLGVGKTVYIDTSFYSVSGTYGGFSNIRVTRALWDGRLYVV